MAQEKELFDNRLRRIDRKHRRLANGFTPVVADDGLISVRPHRIAPTFPLKGFLLLVAGFILFKAVVLAAIGLPDYEARLDLLRAGTVFEQGGAMLLYPDQFSVAIGAQLTPFFE